MAPQGGMLVNGKLKESFYTSGFNVIPKYRDQLLYKYSADMWLQELKDEDAVYPYWRIHDRLYDLTEFMKIHPGGRSWIENTQGLDITEAFECCHFTDNPRKVCEKYFVKEISKKRTSPFTFKENGFFRTLKQKADPIIRKVNNNPTPGMTFTQDFVFSGFLALTMWGCIVKSHFVMVIAGIVLSLNTMCAHNFFHKKDNYRMYMFDFSLLSSMQWRTTHATLHHLFPNTIFDYEVFAFDPFMKLLPNQTKNFYHKYLSWTPLNPYMVFGTMLEYIMRPILFISGRAKFEYPYLIQPLLLTVMTLMTHSFTQALALWITLHVCSTYGFVMLTVAGSHHHYEASIEGDKFIDDKDWGLLQIAATTDRKNVSKSEMLAALFFGNHTLHHLFPTVDNSKLPHLMEPFLETCQQFGIEYEAYSEWNIFKQYFWRLANETPNPKLPARVAHTYVC